MNKKRTQSILKIFLTGFSILNFIISPAISVSATDYNLEREQRLLETVSSNQITGWPDGPQVGADAAILMELETGTILYAKNIHKTLYPASTTKIMTALLAAENSELNDMVEFSKEAVYSVPWDGSNMGMDEGEALTMKDALYGILLLSANETCNAVAEHISGSIDSFIQTMNERAKELGCLNTNFVTTNGLHDENHYTTAYDLAMIGRAFFANPLLAEISGTRSYHWQATDRQPDDFTLNTKNKLLPGCEYSYEYIIGSKTGYTNESRQTLVSAAKKDGMTLICVILKEESPYQFQDTIDLFNYGFSNFQKVNIKQNESTYVLDHSDFFNTNQDVFGSSEPILNIGENDFVVIPNQINFSDLSVTLSYDDLKESTVASLLYTYQDVLVGKADVTFEVQSASTFDFASDDLTTEETSQTDSIDSPKPEKNTVFIYVNRVFYWIIAFIILIIAGIFIRSVFRNYHFEKKSRKKRRKRYHSSTNSKRTHMGTRSQRKVVAERKKKRRKDTRIHFDYRDFQDLE